MINLFFSFSVTFVILFILLKTRLASLAIDQPNARSLHTRTTPRTGGIAIISGILVAWILVGVSLEWIALPLVLVAISLIDDIRGLKARWRFLAHFSVCSVFLALHQGNIATQLIPLVLLSMVWIVNLYNFMDGSDGLAGGMALFGFGTYAITAYFAGQMEMLMTCATVASANLAFLILNFHPAKIFMGDSGSIPLGFLAAALGILGWQHTVWPIWFPLLVFSPFIVDATVTLAKRLLKREKIWLAHKSHYYQRLIQMGWGHRKTAFAEYVLMLASGITAILLIEQDAIVVSFILILWVLIYVGLMWIIDQKWQSKHS